MTDATDASGTVVRVLSTAEAGLLVPRLAEILVDAVDGGASVNFMAPFPIERAEAFWVALVAREGLTVLVAEVDSEVVGTVSVAEVPMENQAHRAEITKLLVHRAGRRRGVAEALMVAAERVALAAGRTLLVLDTVTGGDADRLYRRLGWVEVGTVPDYALMPDGTPAAATIFFKVLKPPTAPGPVLG